MIYTWLRNHPMVRFFLYSIAATVVYCAGLLFGITELGWKFGAFGVIAGMLCWLMGVLTAVVIIAFEEDL